jgi:hypothetical protein
MPDDGQSPETQRFWMVTIAKYVISTATSFDFSIIRRLFTRNIYSHICCICCDGYGLFKNADSDYIVANGRMVSKY